MHFLVELKKSWWQIDSFPQHTLIMCCTYRVVGFRYKCKPVLVSVILSKEEFNHKVQAFQI